MNAAVVLPALLAAVAGVLATSRHRRLAPATGALLLTATMASVLIAVVPAVLVISAGFVTHLPGFDGALSWCRDALGVHDRVPPLLGVPATLLVAFAVVRLRRVWALWRRFHCSDSSGVEVVASAEIFAYTMPGPAGHVVVSRGLVDRLDDAEYTVVLAHERSHAAHRHDRYILFGAVAVALLPILEPQHARLKFTLERWANEDTVRELHVDRTSVARTLAMVALASAPVPAGATGVVGIGVAGRVAALLEPPSAATSRSSLMLGGIGIAAALAAAVVQAHHLAPLLSALPRLICTAHPLLARAPPRRRCCSGSSNRSRPRGRRCGRGRRFAGS